MRARGYLTLNPLKYSHPLLSLGLPLLFIALGGSACRAGGVPAHGFHDPAPAALVNLAGLFANFVLAIVLLGAARLFFDPGHAVFWAGGVPGLSSGHRSGAQPAADPGLDGYAALEPHLSPSTRRALEPVRRWVHDPWCC